MNLICLDNKINYKSLDNIEFTMYIIDVIMYNPFNIITIEHKTKVIKVNYTF